MGTGLAKTILKKYGYFCAPPCSLSPSFLSVFTIGWLRDWECRPACISYPVDLADSFVADQDQYYVFADCVPAGWERGWICSCASVLCCPGQRGCQHPVS